MGLSRNSTPACDRRPSPRWWARRAAIVQYRTIAAVSRWPPEKTSRICATRSRSVRSTASGLSISTRTPFGIAARTPASSSAMPSRLPALLPATCCSAVRSTTSPSACRSAASSRSSKRIRRNCWPDQSARPSGSSESRWASRSVRRACPTMPPRRVTMPGVVAADAREVVLQRTQPGTQGRGPVARQRGHVGARHPADVLAHGAGERAEPGFLRELGHGVDGGADLAVGARPLARGGGERGPGGGGGLHRGGDVPGERDGVLGRRIGGRPVEAPDDVPEALRGRGDGVAFAARRRARPGRCRWRRPRRPGGPARRGRCAPGRPPGRSARRRAPPSAARR